MVLAAYPAVFDLLAPSWGPGSGTNGEDAGTPPTVPASAMYLNPAGAYLVDAAAVMFLWVGGQAPQRLVQVRTRPETCTKTGIARQRALRLSSCGPALEIIKMPAGIFRHARQTV